jgi:hypothetical protein
MDFEDHNLGATASAKPESTSWEVPREVQLRLEPGQSYELCLRVGEACEIQWDISLIGSGSCRVAAGEAQPIRLVLPSGSQPRSLLRGQIIVRRANGALWQSIPVCGWVRIPSQTSGKPEAKRLTWWKLAWLALPVCIVIALVWHYIQPPTLIVEPGQTNLGTLWYSPPVGGRVETSIVFTARWRVPPRDLDNPVLIARKALHYVGAGGAGDAPEETFAISLSSQTNEARIALGCYNLTNETVRVNGTISLTLSNSSARILPAEFRFKAEFKPGVQP